MEIGIVKSGSIITQISSYLFISCDNILSQGNLNIVPTKAMTYKYNITHSFDVTLDVCYKTLIPWLSMSYYIYNT